LRFSELFGTAFKTRVNGGGVYPGQRHKQSAIQNIPGAIYYSESGFISNFSGSGGGPLTDTVGGLTFSAGLADYGTRLKAVFSNIPTGVSVWVSAINLNGSDRHWRRSCRHWHQPSGHFTRVVLFGELRSWC
jgi:hypothetical protein